MSIKLNLVQRYMNQGHTKQFAIKMAEDRDREATKPLAKPSAEVIARRLLEQNIFGGVK